jgi:hypothetical protein
MKSYINLFTRCSGRGDISGQAGHSAPEILSISREYFSQKASSSQASLALPRVGLTLGDVTGATTHAFAAGKMAE